MPLTIHPLPEAALTPEEAEAWAKIPVSIIGDELNRSGVMDAGIKPLGDGRPFAGPALTVDCMVGDNSALHHALTLLEAGWVLVADGHRHVDTALWGDIMHSAAKVRRAAAVVIDGSMRDRVAIAASGLPAYARGVCPRGPHKGWGGAVNVPIQCGGVAVAPGDLVVGDADGVAVVRADQLPGLMERCLKRMAREEEVLKEIAAGRTTVEILGIAAEKVGR
ncbi:MAG: RraA family protein [Dehalococcoidia bacterium]